MIRQTTPYSVQEYMDAGCQTLAIDGKLDAIGVGIHSATGGMPCTGCFSNDRCKAYAQLRSGSKAQENKPKPAMPETVREEAARLGISIGDVRRRRQQATTVLSSYRTPVENDLLRAKPRE